MVTRSDGVGSVVESNFKLVVEIRSRSNDVEYLQMHAFTDSIRLRVFCSDSLVLDSHRVQQFLELLSSKLRAQIVNNEFWSGVSAKPDTLKAESCGLRGATALQENFKPTKLAFDHRQTVEVFNQRAHEINVHHIKGSVSICQRSWRQAAVILFSAM